MKILDATCGTRSIWFPGERKNKDTIYIDIRPEVKPDIVCSATATPFEQKTFDMIIFDPPFRQFGKNSIFGKKYSVMSKSDINIFIKDAFWEFARILKDDGVVVFKWGTYSDLGLYKVLKLAHGFVPMLGWGFNRIQNYKTTWTILRKNLNGKQGEL
jgi:tRNA G10  N-methylase Trm11